MNHLKSFIDREKKAWRKAGKEANSILLKWFTKWKYRSV